MSIENLKTYDPFAEADEDTGEKTKAADYIHIRIQQRNGRKTLTTVQGIPPKFSRKKILAVVKKKFGKFCPPPSPRPCNGTIVTDAEMGEVIQLQGDQRKAMQEFLTAKDGLELDPNTIKIHGF
ncbi:putative translation initiation factor protein [Phaeoacremonium minimum UCRPA7]|uniref:Putative translation initiation factor protein n=1 Tax=Phaeoacremonium minimum (strain UCR-PA7) TaxID=1286976 RepID=R8BI85_PHAM7|nr:putative translation initiation factor protein [Phaeoacremonium minimum UCRPA7]EON98989.1 putative translation initiation factor protein [Phaeoacremonium minimum UCRPA7]